MVHAAWMNLPEIGLAHDPKIQISKNIGGVFQDLPMRFNLAMIYLFHDKIFSEKIILSDI